MLIIFHIYSVIGTELLTYTQEEYDRINSTDPNLAYYKSNVYGNFTTFKDSLFALFQILTESSWHMVVLYHELFHGFWLPFFFLLPFHMFITFIMRSILLGMTWEVFAVVNEEEDYLMNEIEVDKDFKYILEDDDYPNDK